MSSFIGSQSTSTPSGNTSFVSRMDQPWLPFSFAPETNTSVLISVRIFFAMLFLVWAFNGVAIGENVKGQRDLLVLLPGGPFHLRLVVVDGKRSLEEMRVAFIDALIAKLDVNADGQLSKEETRNSALFMTGRRFDETELAQRLPPSKGMSKSAVSLSIERAIGQSMVFRQVGAVAEQDLQVFKVLDDDSSGLIERIEMRTAPARLASRDLDHDHCITFDEFMVNNADGMMADQVMMMAADVPPPTIHSELLRDAREPVLPSRLIRRYDDDKDGKLSGKELGWPPERIAELDRDKDGVLTVSELSRLADGIPDLALSIQFGKSGAGESSMQLISTRNAEQVKSVTNAAVDVKLPSTSVSISYRQNDPVEEAMKNARETFNAIDLDANGYMDRAEIATHPRFQRYLFDAMDIDRDDRVFGKEMDDYVRGFAEPSATTCQVTLFDSGNGYFQMLDVNTDGRISIRELRNAEKQLMSLAGATTHVINPSQLPRYFRIEVQRGGPMPFSSINRPVAERPQALLRPPVGPIWFQRMDRNGDGDLVWDEFLGPRDVFNRLDQDHDELIDATEAEAAK